MSGDQGHTVTEVMLGLTSTEEDMEAGGEIENDALKSIEARHPLPMSLKYEPASEPPSSASLGLADYSQVDTLGLRYTSVNFGVGKRPVSPNW